MQDAYVAEQGDSVGTWQAIGYTAPGTYKSGSTKESETSNFTYKDNLNKTTLLTGMNNTQLWQASNKTVLNKCPAAANWTLTGAVASAGGALEYTAGYNNKDKCSPLTPNFDKIGK